MKVHRRIYAPFLALALLGVLTACAVSKEVPQVSVDQKRCTSLEAFLTYSAQNPRYAGSKVAQVQDTHLDHFVAAFNATGTPTSYDPDRVHIIVSPNGYGVVIFINDNCVTDAGEFPWPLIVAWGEGRVPEGKQDTRV